MKIEHKIILFSAIFGVLFWIIDGLLHYSASYGDSFWGLLILNLRPEEFYHRLVILVGFIVSGIFLSKFFVARKKAEKALRQSEKNYRLVVENAGEAIIVVQDGKIRFINKKAIEITGYAEKELTSRPFIDFIHPDDREMVGTNYLKRQRGEEVPPVYSFRILDKGENLKWVEVSAIPYSWKGHTSILYFLKNITDYRATENSLQNRLAIEKLLTEISSRFINIARGELDSGIKSALQILGELARVDRVHFFLFSLDKKKIEHTYEWHAKQAKARVDKFRNISLEPFQWSMGKLMRFEPVYVPRVDNLPPEANPEKEIWQSQGLGSCLTIPLILGDSLIGSLGFNSELAEKSWGEEDIRLLKMVGEIFANVIAHQRGEEALIKIEESFQRLAQENAIIAEIGRIVGSTLDIKEVYERFAEEVGNLIFSDRIAINLFDIPTYTLTLTYFSGPEVASRKEGEVISLAGTGAEEVWKTRSPLLINEKNREMILDRFPGLSPHFKAGSRSIMIIPLITKNEVIGVLFFRSKKLDAYAEADVKLAEKVSAQIAGAIANAQLYSKQKQAEEALRSSEERYRLLVENAPLGILSIDTQGQIIDVNPILLSMFGFPSAHDTRAINMLTFPTLRKVGISENFQRCLKSGERGVFESPYTTNWGKEVYLRYHLTPIRNQDGQVSGVQALMEDISGEKKLKEQLTQAQKMEAIGTLAGGIAHDFNNILSAIMGYTQIAILGVAEEYKTKQNLESVLNATHRAKDLVKQILTFSRRSGQERKPMQITPIVKEALKLLRASLPSTIEIRQQIESDLGVIEADPTRVHQVFMNLCTNAAHAMSENGGVMEVALTNVEIDENAVAQNQDLHPGPYLRLTVSDTGHGMAPKVLERIFDPYFTTKKVGEGTGLGLAMVHGIIKSYGGVIKVDSELGKGSAFHVYFPRVDSVKEVPEIQELELLPLEGHERILFVDDEKALVDLGEKMLEYLGYEVVARTSSIEALECFRYQPDKFHLVITDMTMPNMTGDKLAQEVMRIRPGIPVILCTGFSERISEMKAKALGIQEFVMKPFDLNEIARTIRRALEKKKKTVTNQNLQLLEISG